MEIDLGTEAVINVKIGSTIYKLHEPTVDDIEVFQSKVKDKDKSLHSFVNFLIKLGMPEEVARSLGVLRLKKLADGLVGGLSEKK